jgi:hypothetical protein
VQHLPSRPPVGLTCGTDYNKKTASQAHLTHTWKQGDKKTKKKWKDLTLMEKRMQKLARDGRILRRQNKYDIFELDYTPKQLEQKKFEQARRFRKKPQGGFVPAEPNTAYLAGPTSGRSIPYVPKGKVTSATPSVGSKTISLSQSPVQGTTSTNPYTQLIKPDSETSPPPQIHTHN